MLDDWRGPKVPELVQKKGKDFAIPFCEGKYQQKDFIFFEVDWIRRIFLTFCLGIWSSGAYVDIECVDEVFDYVKVLVVYCEV